MPNAIDVFDWSTTPLGPKSQWSPALQTAYDMIMGTGFAACATWGPEQTLIYNAAYIPFLGARHPDSLGRPIREVWHDVWDEISPLLDEALAGGRVYLEDLHLVMTRNGYPEDTYWTFSYSPLRDGDRIEGILDIAIDTTSRVAAERRNAILMAETTHRLKNTLSVVQAIARQSLRGVSAPAAAVNEFEQRLEALASAHDVLQTHDWSEADLGALIAGALQRLVDRPRYELAGPALRVSAQVAQTVSLVIHELATNAIKHGAWSRDEGRVLVTWRETGAAVTLVWREVGGPAAARPTKRSFGSRLIGGGLVGSGGVELDFAPSGLTATFTTSVDDLLAK